MFAQYGKVTGTLFTFDNDLQTAAGAVGGLFGPSVYAKSAQAASRALMAAEERVTAGAAALRGLGVPDYRIVPTPYSAGTLYSNPLPLSLERIGAEGGIDLTLKFKPNWTEAQRAEAVAKAQILNDASTVVTVSERAGTAAAINRYRRSDQFSGGRDIDHKVDLQLGGSKAIENLWALDSSVNRSLGVQIHQKIKDLPLGTRINRVTIGD